MAVAPESQRWGGHRLGAVIVAGVVSAFLLLPTTATASSAAGSTGLRIVDLSLVRLRVPTKWAFTLAGEGCRQKSACASATLPGTNDSIDIAQVPPRGCTGRDVNAIWISRIPVRPQVATTVSKVACDRGVRVVDPALGVTLYGFGAGVAAARSAKPSGLADLLGTRLTYGPLRDSKRITYEHFIVEVPRTWPEVDLGRGDRHANPGSCALPPFPTPTAYTGWSGVVLHCPAITVDSSEKAASAPGNGVWLSPVTLDLSTGAPGTAPAYVSVRRIGKVTVSISRPIRLTGSGSVDMTLTSGASRAVLELGLGVSPKIAEEILDSVHVA